ncbi:MAG: hypothetical protein AAB432_01770 [Patescibacteria group bacterium]
MEKRKTNTIIAGVVILITLLSFSYFQVTSPLFVANKDNAFSFTTITETKTGPKFVSGKIDPLNVHVGDTQKMNVAIESNSPLKRAWAEIQTDNTIITVDLRLISTKNAENSLVIENVYEGSWIVHDTHRATYRTTFFALDENGQTAKNVLAWSDPCNFSGGQLQTNCSYASGIDGVDNANMSFAAGTSITLSGTAQLVFNPGKSMTIGNGTINLGSGTSIKKSNMYYTDTDGDGHAPNATVNLSGGTRVYAASGTNDCYDSGTNASNVHPNQTSFFTTARGDGSFDYDCNGQQEFDNALTCIDQGVCSTNSGYQNMNVYTQANTVSTPSLLAANASWGSACYISDTSGHPGCGQSNSYVSNAAGVCNSKNSFFKPYTPGVATVSCR